MSIPEPQHPGFIIRRECLDPLGLSVIKAARALGVTRQALNNVVNAKAGISPEMAIRLGKVFGEEPEAWLQRQLVYDLAQARKRVDQIKVSPLRMTSLEDLQARLF